jgi:hypothetical protein
MEKMLLSRADLWTNGGVCELCRADFVQHKIGMGSLNFLIAKIRGGHLVVFSPGL